MEINKDLMNKNIIEIKIKSNLKIYQKIKIYFTCKSFKFIIFSF